MPAPVFSARAFSDAVLVLLRAEGIPIGDSVAPANDPPTTLVGWVDGVFRPYAVYYPLTGGVADGPIDDPEADFQPMFQLTCVAASRRSAEWVSDKLRAALIGSTIDLGDREVIRFRTDMSGGIQRDDDVRPVLYYLADRYRAVTTG